MRKPHSTRQVVVVIVVAFFMGCAPNGSSSLVDGSTDQSENLCPTAEPIAGQSCSIPADHACVFLRGCYRNFQCNPDSGQWTIATTNCP